jgi:hypothetical protein
MTTREFARAAPILLSAFATVGVSTAAELELTRINACKDISEAFATLKRTSTNCGAPTGVIERTIRDLAAGSEARLCFMERPPVASLSDFRCIQSSYRGARAFACYRSASSDLLGDYKSNFSRKYSAETSAYIEEAKRCPGSNGDASRAIDTTFPPILMAVAEHGFGFNVQYGDTRPGTALVSHGFAKTAPSVAQRGPDAIEYVVFSDGVAPELTARISLGNWRVQVDTSPDFASQFATALKRQGLEAYVAFVDLDIQRAPLAPPLLKRQAIPEELSDVVASKLDDEGFEEMSDDELEKHTGKSRRELIDTVLKGLPFGSRKILNGRVPKFRLLIKTSGLPCTRGGRGAIGAYLFAFEGEKDVQADFGSLMAMVLGFGSCASSVNSGREYARNLAEESKQAALDELQGH